MFFALRAHGVSECGPGQSHVGSGWTYDQARRAVPTYAVLRRLLDVAFEFRNVQHRILNMHVREELPTKPRNVFFPHAAPETPPQLARVIRFPVLRVEDEGSEGGGKIAVEDGPVQYRL